jgi:hypothetical protein
MREDMAKVLVERPRCVRGFRRGSKKGYKRELQRGFGSPDRLRPREGMKVRSGGGKSFNENLAPLRRFLNSNVGRPWDKVFAEISRHVNPCNVVQKYILTHLDDYVVTNVDLVDGVPCYRGYPRGWGRWFGKSISGQWTWYVCPKSGLLRKAPPREKRRAETHAVHWFAKDRFCKRLPDGSWLLAQVKPVPTVEGFVRPSGGYDVWLKRTIEAREGWKFYNAAVFVASYRVVGVHDLKHYPIPVDVYRPPVQNKV